MSSYCNLKTIPSSTAVPAIVPTITAAPPAEISGLVDLKKNAVKYAIPEMALSPAETRALLVVSSSYSSHCFAASCSATPTAIDSPKLARTVSKSRPRMIFSNLPFFGVKKASVWYAPRANEMTLIWIQV